jgi:hypothetical protein
VLFFLFQARARRSAIEEPPVRELG